MTQAIDFQKHLDRKLQQFKEFVFVSDSALRQSSKKEQKPKLQLASNNNYLNRAVIGDYVTVEQIYTSREVTRKLRDYKFEPEQRVQLLSRNDTGSVVVKIDDTLIGIGTEIASRIVVSWGGK